jgi:LTXXQ motif family protein
MRNICAICGVAALAASVSFPLPAIGFGIQVGPYYFRVPFVRRHYHHHGLYGGRSKTTATRGENPDQTNREVSTEGLESCTGLVPGVTNLSIDQIRQTVNPTADQGTALDDLSAALSLAKDVIKSSCPSSIPLTPVGRLDATERRVDAIIRAIQILRSPLMTFHEALRDEQRRQFNQIKVSTTRAHSAASLCNQQGSSFIDVPAERIEEVLEPTPEQRSAFDDLRKATQRAADQLQSSCPTAVPQSPVARLDTVEIRLKATADAIKSIRPALESFYASLDDERKARFNIMGPRTGSSQSQH